MPAHRKPLETLQMSGATRQNPQRFRERKASPKPSGEIGDPPKHLKAAEKRVWAEIVSQMPAGVLGNTHRIALELLCVLTVRFRKGELKNGSELAQYRMLLAQFGMTPIDGNKLQAPQSEPDEANDEWSAVIRRPSKSIRDGSNDGEDPGFEVGQTRVQ